MGKITFPERTFLIVLLLLGSSLTFLTATTKHSAAISINETVTNVSCHGQNDGAINTTITGGTGTYTISWNTGQTTEDIANLTAGSYTITVTDENGPQSKTIQVSQPEVLVMGTPSSNPPSCNGGSDGSITAGTVTGGTGEYQYSIDGINFSASNSFSGLPAGNYTLTVKDANGCTDKETATVSEPAVLDMAAASSTSVSCNGGSDGTVTAGAVSGGNGGYQYSIDGINFSTSNSFSGLTTGTYTITLKDSEGCTETETATVSEPAVLTMAAASTTPVSCNGGSDGTVTAGNVSGGTGSYQYKLDNGSFGNSSQFANLSAGNYIITVKDANGCQTSQSVTVTQPELLAMTAPSSTPVSCNGGNDVTVTAGSVSGGTSPYQYQLNNGSYGTAKEFTGLSAGTYTVTVKDANGCQTSQSVTVTQPEVLAMATPNSTPVSCNGGNDGTVTAGTVSGGKGAYQYKLDSGSFGNSAQFSNLSAGNYIITVKDANGCQTSQSVTVTQPEVLAMTAPTSTPISCNGGNDGTVTAGNVSGGNGDYQYKLNSGTYGTSNTFTNLTAGTYIITAKDANGCETSQGISVTEPEVLTMSTPSFTVVSCNGGSDGSITAGSVNGGNGSYQYSLNNGTFQTSNSFTGLSAGFYTLTVKDGKSCTTEQTVEITQPTPIIFGGPTITDVSCNGGNDGKIIAAQASGGNGGYQYSRDGINYSTNGTFNGYTAGNYTIYVRDSKGCVAEKTFTITQPDVLAMTTSASTTTTCFGGSDGTITAGTVSGGSGDYLFSLDNTNFSSTGSFSGISAGTYTIFVKDSKGCSLQQTITVAQPEIIKATTSKTDVKCFGGNTGTITVSNPTGGSNNYEYSLNGTNWVTSPNFTGLTLGSYKVLIRDKNNPSCVIVLQETYQINQPSAALNTEIVTTRTTTYGTSTGSATANPTGGTAPYTYEWRKENETAVLQTTKTVNNFPAGNYTLTVVDSKGCKIVEPFTIIDALQASIVSKSICESEGGATDIRTSYFEVENLTAVGGVAPYQYSWDFAGAISPSRTGIGEHKVIYTEIGNKIITLTVTDSIGKQFTVTQSLYVGKCYEPCGKSENIVFDPNNFYVGDSNGTPINLLTNCLDNQEKFIYLKVDKSANAYNPYVELVYIIRNDINEVTETNFIKGCRDGNDIDEDPTNNQSNKIGEYIRFTSNPIDFKCGDNLDIDNFYITWTNVSKKDCGQNNNAFCYSINDPLIIPTPLKAEATANEILCKGEASGIINVKVSGGFAPYTYSLTEANPNYQPSNQFINKLAGNYTVYVKDARGNKTTANVSIIEPEFSISAEITSTPPQCFGGTGTASVTAEGGTIFTTDEPYEYLWNDANQQTGATAIGLPAGSYTVTIIDKNGCQLLKAVTITEPEELTEARAGEDQILNCGFNSTSLEANIPETGVGIWTIETGTGGEITESSDSNTTFTGEAGTYTLRWTISHPDGSCNNYDEVTVTFTDDCSKLDFDGVDDHIVFGNNYPFTSGTFTIEAWVKLKSTSGVKTILSKRNASNPGEGGYDLVVNNGAPTFRWGNNSVSTSSKLDTTRWYHLAVIHSGSKVNLYVDGIKVGTSNAVNPLNMDKPFIIGASFDSANQSVPKDYFHGWIEEVRLWKTSLTEEQLRFMMNQRIEANGTKVKGSVLPMLVPDNLLWENLEGYYQLQIAEVVDGLTLDRANFKVDGILKNITTPQENTAPLPYISENDGNWRTKANWLRPNVWDVPNGIGINGESINWNIARVNNNFTSEANDITLLSLLLESGSLKMANPNESEDEKNSGHALIITHYLQLNGFIDLVGESQLIQTDIADPLTGQTITSVLEESSTGYITRAQQGTANSFNYNYWSSPVSKQGAANNSTYTVKGVMLDGSPTANYGEILDFNDWHEYADYAYAANAPRRVSNYWINKFRGTANVYSEWERIGSTGILYAGEGYTMKGTSGQAEISDRQNYLFKGKPNNGTIPLNIQQNQNYLLGNPYPSAIDINKFILDNLNAADVEGGTNSANIFNGAVYFWDHFAGGNTHILLEYIGGYATRNLIDGVPAISNDYRVNANDAKGSKVPGPFIPVAQGFFINSVIDPEIAGNISVDGGNVLFKNSQRTFMRESSGNTGNSVFLRPEEHSKQEAEVDKRSKIRLDFKSPMGYYRQILVGVDENASNGFDLGYDALMNDYNLEDMYWLIGGREFVIQGVSNFGLTQVLPLGIRIEKEGEIMIKIHELKNIGEEVDIFLKDKSNNAYYDLRESEAKINLTQGEIVDRFEIVFEKQKEITPDPDETTVPEGTPGDGTDPNEGANPDPVENPEKILPPGTIDVIFAEDDHQLRILNPDELKIRQVEIFNLVGQKIEMFHTNSNLKQLNFQVQEHPSALYVVKVFAEEGMVSKNILIMK